MATTTNNGWTIPADTDLVRDGALAIRTLGNGIDTSFGKWLSTWTPTIGGTGWAIGNGSVVGRYHRIGDTVHWYLQFTFGSTTTKGTGGLAIGLPTTLSGTVDQWCTGAFYDTSTNTYYRLSGKQSGGSVIPYSGGTTMQVLTSTLYPVAYGTGDTIELTGTYRSA